jgi:hypothetical protein
LYFGVARRGALGGPSVPERRGVQSRADEASEQPTCSAVTEDGMSTNTLLLIILILLLLGALPMWPYSSGWGYYPSGGLGLLLIILLVVLLVRRA